MSFLGRLKLLQKKVCCQLSTLQHARGCHARVSLPSSDAPCQPCCARHSLTAPAPVAQAPRAVSEARVTRWAGSRLWRAEVRFHSLAFDSICCQMLPNTSRFTCACCPHALHLPMCLCTDLWRCFSTPGEQHVRAAESCPRARASRGCVTLTGGMA